MPPDARDSGGEDAGLHLFREGHVLRAKLPVLARESQRERTCVPPLFEGGFLCRILCRTDHPAMR